MSLYKHVPHPHIRARLAQGPVKVDSQRPDATAFQRFNKKLGLKITALVGTMVCAYVFFALALVSLPGALKTGDLVVIVAWTAQTFLQLVLLPIIIVGQNVQAEASDKRAEQTYNDAEAILSSALQIQEHLAAQDTELQHQTAALMAILAKYGPPPPPAAVPSPVPPSPGSGSGSAAVGAP
jgi:cytochrome c biogenesis factor